MNKDTSLRLCRAVDPNKQTEINTHKDTLYRCIAGITPRPGCVQVWSLSPCLRGMLISEGSCQLSHIRLYLPRSHSLRLRLSASSLLNLSLLLSHLVPYCIFRAFLSFSSRSSSHTITANQVFFFSLLFCFYILMDLLPGSDRWDLRHWRLKGLFRKGSVKISHQHDISFHSSIPSSCHTPPSLSATRFWDMFVPCLSGFCYGDQGGWWWDAGWVSQDEFWRTSFQIWRAGGEEREDWRMVRGETVVRRDIYRLQRRLQRTFPLGYKSWGGVKEGGHLRADSGNNGETDDYGAEWRRNREEQIRDENMKCGECTQFRKKSVPNQWFHMCKVQVQKKPFSFLKQRRRAETQIKRDVALLTWIAQADGQRRCVMVNSFSSLFYSIRLSGLASIRRVALKNKCIHMTHFTDSISMGVSLLRHPVASIPICIKRAQAEASSSSLDDHRDVQQCNVVPGISRSGSNPYKLVRLGSQWPPLGLLS